MPKRSRRVTDDETQAAGSAELEREARESHTSPALSGGDVDADWEGAASAGEEAVGGSVATPDQDRVDEIGRALGVEQAADAEVRTSAEILEERDRRRAELEPDGASE